MALVLSGYVGGFLAFMAMRRSRSERAICSLALLTIVLVGAASAPMVWSFTQAFTEEWCEYQPGGRGNPNTNPEDIPPIC